MPNNKLNFKNQYENYIGGEWLAPIDGEYFDDISSIDGSVLTKVPKSSGKDIDLAIQAGQKAFVDWGKNISH